MMENEEELEKGTKSCEMIEEKNQKPSDVSETPTEKWLKQQLASWFKYCWEFKVRNKNLP